MNYKRIISLLLAAVLLLGCLTAGADGQTLRGQFRPGQAQVCLSSQLSARDHSGRRSAGIHPQLLYHR